MDNGGDRLVYLRGQLLKYKKAYEEKRRLFRGVRHEDSLSELRYTEYMVYKDMVDSLVREIRKLESGLKGSRVG